MLPIVEYLSHKIFAQGSQLTQEEIQAIHEVPVQADIGQLSNHANGKGGRRAGGFLKIQRFTEILLCFSTY